MYVSGTLKDKAITFYKPKIMNFSENEFMTNKILFSYDGEIISLPWDKDKITKLAKRQELLIQKFMENILVLASKKYPSLKTEIQKMFQIIIKTPRKFTYGLFECLYETIISSNKDELLKRLTKLELLINYLEEENINQIDFDIIRTLFLKQKDYDKTSLFEEKVKKFHIIDEEIPTNTLRTIITFGEFISPKRVPKIASTLNQDIKYSNMVLPIYFAIPNELDANKFLMLCKNSSLDEEQIKKNATRLRIPENITNLIR